MTIRVEQRTAGVGVLFRGRRGRCARLSLAVASALIAWPAAIAHADTCYETAQVNIDCSPKAGGGAAASPSTSDLRETLRRALQRGAGQAPPPVSAEDLSKSIHEAEARAQRALDAATSTADPAQQEKAIKAYNAAIRDLDAAYDKAAEEADSAAGRDKLLKMKATDEGALAAKADDASAAQLAAADAARPKAPDNIGMAGSDVVVCDGPVTGDHVACREIQPDGKNCVSVIAFEGEVNWRDSTTTPCSADDLAQRTSFLAAHDGADQEVRDAAGKPFVMDERQNCQALIGGYVAAAQAQDGPGAQSAYEALRNAGGCGVLAQAEQQQKAAAGSDPRFATRGDTPMIDQIAGGCDRNPQACAAAIEQARQGASPAAVAAIYANAIGVGLQLGTMMGNAALNAQAQNMARAAALNRAAADLQRRRAQYPYALSCNSRGCILSDGRGPNNTPSDITGTGR